MKDENISIDDVEGLLKKAERMERQCTHLINECDEVLHMGRVSLDEIVLGDNTEKIEWTADKIKSEHKFN